MNKIIKINTPVHVMSHGERDVKVLCDYESLENIVGGVIADTAGIQPGGKCTFVGVLKINIELTQSGVTVT